MKSDRYEIKQEVYCADGQCPAAATTTDGRLLIRGYKTTSQLPNELQPNSQEFVVEIPAEFVS